MDAGQSLPSCEITLPRPDPLYVRGLVLVMLAGAFWSLGGVLVRSVDAASEWQILFVRSCALALALFCVLVVRYRSQVLQRMRKAGLLSVAGGLCIAASSIGWIFALTHTTVANAVFILCAAPIFAALLGRLVLGELVSNATWMAMVGALAGIAVMVLGGIRASALFGNLMAIV